LCFTRVEYGHLGSTPVYCKECKTCRQRARDTDLRDRSDRVDTRTKADRNKTFNFRLNNRYDMYKFRDCEKGLSIKDTYEDSLPREFAYKLMIKPCTYCRKLPTDKFPNGLDRIDNSKGHIIGNVLPCCHQCNMKKKTDSFRKDIIHSIKKVKNKRSYCITTIDHMECPF